jgi:predicted TIM-barrel fold metal-dependent hydrolase
MSGVFEQLPELRVVLLESGWTWLPSLLWRMDREWKGLRREVPWMTELPSAYVREHFRLTTNPTDAPADGAYVREMVEQLGSDGMLMFGSDYPHRYPAADDLLRRIAAAGAADGVMWGNAERCFPLRRGVA